MFSHHALVVSSSHTYIPPALQPHGRQAESPASAPGTLRVRLDFDYAYPQYTRVALRKFKSAPNDGDGDEAPNGSLHLTFTGVDRPTLPVEGLVRHKILKWATRTENLRRRLFSLTSGKFRVYVASARWTCKRLATFRPVHATTCMALC